MYLGSWSGARLSCMPPEKMLAWARRTPPECAFQSSFKELKIPPTQFATVLLFNDAHHPGWTVTRNGKPASLLRANAAMRAVHLPAAEKGQTVVFQFQPATASTMPFWVLLILSLPAFIMMWRER